MIRRFSRPSWKTAERWLRSLSFPLFSFFEFVQGGNGSETAVDGCSLVWMGVPWHGMGVLWYGMGVLYYGMGILQCWMGKALPASPCTNCSSVP